MGNVKALTDLEEVEQKINAMRSQYQKELLTKVVLHSFLLLIQQKIQDSIHQFDKDLSSLRTLKFQLEAGYTFLN